MLSDPTGLVFVCPPSDDFTSHVVCDGNGGVMFNPFERPADSCEAEVWESHEQQHIDDLAASDPSICEGEPVGAAICLDDVQEQGEFECPALEAQLNTLKAMDAANRCCALVGDPDNGVSTWQGFVDSCYSLGYLP